MKLTALGWVWPVKKNVHVEIQLTSVYAQWITHPYVEQMARHMEIDAGRIVLGLSSHVMENVHAKT